MNSSLIDKMEFPEMPSLRGWWYPVVIQPITHSFEKVTVAVIAVDTNSNSIIKEAITDEQYKQIFGASGMRNIVDICLTSIRNHLNKGEVLEKWNSPFTGVELGLGREAADETLEGIAIQGLRMSSFLYSLSSNK